MSVLKKINIVLILFIILTCAIGITSNLIGKCQSPDNTITDNIEDDINTDTGDNTGGNGNTSEDNSGGNDNTSGDNSGGNGDNTGDNEDSIDLVTAMLNLDTFVNTYIKSEAGWSSLSLESQSTVSNTDDEKGRLIGSKNYVQYYKECVNLLTAYYSALWNVEVGENNSNEKTAMIAAIESYRDAITKTDYTAEYESDIAAAVKAIYANSKIFN